MGLSPVDVQDHNFASPLRNIDPEFLLEKKRVKKTFNFKNHGMCALYEVSMDRRERCLLSLAKIRPIPVTQIVSCID